MNFNYEEENRKLELANCDIQKVNEKYNKILSNLSEKDLNLMQLYYYFKKLDTIKNMTPKGWNDFEAKRNKYISKGMSIIEKLVEKLYPNINNIDEIQEKVNIDMNSNLISIINDFSTDIKNTYKKYCDHLFTVLPISGLTELKASKHRENQYWSSINDGIFAISTISGIEKYVARANVGGMVVNGKEIKYPANPFSSISEKGLTLVKPVSIYLINPENFEPQFDFIIDSEGVPKFIYGGEWIAEYERINCTETQIKHLPTHFIRKNDVYYREKGEYIQLNETSKNIVVSDDLEDRR